MCLKTSHIVHFVLFLFILLGDATVTHSQAITTIVKAAEREGSKWQRHTPGGETSCALGSKFQFYTREASPEKLLIYFVGGGACWNGTQCNPSTNPTPYTYRLGKVNTKAVEVDGILNVNHPENPFADYTIVAVPTCTGDLFLGDNITEYSYKSDRGKSKTITVHHRGYDNAMTTLEWAFEHVPDPDIVVVSGSSAGGVAAPLYANVVANHYLNARVIGIGDAAGAYRREAMQGVALQNWNIREVIQQHTAFADMDTNSLGVEDLYIQAASQNLPNLELYQVDQAYDQRQRFFLSLAGNQNPDVIGLITENHNEIRNHDPGFRSFLIGGYEHTVFTSPRYYFFESDNMLFRDWVQRILDGEEVESVYCTDCSRPELKYSEIDIKILEKMKELLSSEDRWNANDRYPRNENCRRPFRGLSLRCAITRASEEVAETRRRFPLHYAFLYALHDYNVEYNGNDISALVRFNNHPGRTYTDIMQLIRTVELEIRSEVG
ncbi:pectinacetylesterase family protein [Aliifodinibius sp. S!AR15-10]|uniref:pectin acetylesterase-family hydrolase n=1 Tax=Aliifodinibius sp. S!AR15-10 TaxID=2950437 RepID=UPI0028677B3D|nr:pectin acetylesterase-family hydrolase [Aliifodinibius sp. S!AR15-10]MDR8389552.1 pectinacetylesterase family protein [Aliifodinibius sp. S!AR15-10]